ncbi:hypothetical protein [Mycolicibacterium sp. J2]|jgi:hypothetical protein|uniref:hypothetical protein n=1 Tax=Mycolicibacterium sp. J2 TaxID=2993511 RepID=UPI00224B5FF5|nr:hypothetical protein [Mycolicibacterium sp. J2]MCX2714448.1 hypothetical protein [Mycolicibacterium sp. J2]
MTATLTRPPLSDSTDSLLRFVMRADATVCAGAGLLVAMTADPLSRLSGLSAAGEWIVGAALVCYGAVLYLLAAAPALRRIGIGVVTVNVLIALTTIAVLIADVLPLTAAGVALTLVVVTATLGCAWLQYLGVRRLA